MNKKSKKKESLVWKKVEQSWSLQSLQEEATDTTPEGELAT